MFDQSVNVFSTTSSKRYLNEFRHELSDFVASSGESQGEKPLHGKSMGGVRLKLISFIYIYIHMSSHISISFTFVAMIYEYHIATYIYMYIYIYMYMYIGK